MVVIEMVEAMVILPVAMMSADVAEGEDVELEDISKGLGA